LCDEAKDSQILIDGKVCAAVEGIAELEPLQDLKLEGFHRPIKAANVKGDFSPGGPKDTKPVTFSGGIVIAVIRSSESAAGNCAGSAYAPGYAYAPG
jgi:hypothetical protein